MRDDLKELLKRADKDLEVAKSLLDQKHHEYSCFFSQQSVEKFLKAYLLFKNNSYPFIHSISKLLKMCIDLDSNFEEMLKLKINILEDYYTGTRYPPILEVTEEDAEEAVEIAEKVRDFVVRRLET